MIENPRDREVAASAQIEKKLREINGILQKRIDKNLHKQYYLSPL